MSTARINNELRKLLYAFDQSNSCCTTKYIHTYMRVLYIMRGACMHKLLCLGVVRSIILSLICRIDLSRPYIVISEDVVMSLVDKILSV